MLIGRLTGLLSKKAINKQYGLREEEDFLILYKNGEQVAVFTIHTEISEIERFIEEGTVCQPI